LLRASLSGDREVFSHAYVIIFEDSFRGTACLRLRVERTAWPQLKPLLTAVKIAPLSVDANPHYRVVNVFVVQQEITFHAIAMAL
jgi:hypothetical protein